MALVNMPDDVATKIRARRALPAPAMRKAIRVAANITQTDLASCIDPPVTRETVARWESGARTPRGDILAQYVDVLHQLSEPA
jgi:DNA-binding transcriptional regulator YiaG